MSQGLTYISLFSSAGIGCYGFKLEGFQCIATNELIERRLNIQKNNEKCKYESGYICGDITSHDIKNRLLDEIKFWRHNEKIDDVDVLIATPPCQGMSVANHKKSENEIVRNSLVVESIKLIRDINPRFFIFENVSAFMKTICTDLDGMDRSIGEAISINLGSHYSIYANIINFKNYGASSSRPRTLVMGVRKDLSNNISPIELFPDMRKERTIREVIGNMRSLKEIGEIAPDDIYHGFREYSPHMRKWISSLKEGQSAFENTDIDSIPHQVIDGEIVINQNKNGDKYRRQFWDKVGPCIHTRNDLLASQNTVHPKDDRVFSIRELMRMMTIPDSFKWTNIPLEQLNRLSHEEKRTFLKKEEMNIRQSLGEAVPTEIFKSIAGKIRTLMACDRVNASKINKIIKDEGLTDTDNLIEFIDDNPLKLDTASLAKIAEVSNSSRNMNAAYYTDKTILTEIVKGLPHVEKSSIRILEPSVGAGNFLPFIAKRYEYVDELLIDVVDIDSKALDVLKVLVQKLQLPQKIRLNYINSDFLLHEFQDKYDLVIGNPPFYKLRSDDKRLAEYRRNALNKVTNNTFAFFIEKALELGENIVLITPKYLLSSVEFEKTRELLSKLKFNAIIDFGEHGFTGVLIETLCFFLSTKGKPGKLMVKSIELGLEIEQKQAYIFDNKLPYWLIYRDDLFDQVYDSMYFDIFTVFRDRQITNSMLSKDKGDIWVVKSRNINNEGTELKHIEGYDSFISSESAAKLAVSKFIDNDEVYLTPNMTYYPRVIKKPKGIIVNGSVAVLTPKVDTFLTAEDLLYFSSEEYRRFYKIARNYATRSLNIDSNSVFFFGIKKSSLKIMYNCMV